MTSPFEPQQIAVDDRGIPVGAFLDHEPTPEQIEDMKRQAEVYRAERERDADTALRNAALNAAATVMHATNATAREVLATASEFYTYLKGAQ